LTSILFYAIIHRMSDEDILRSCSSIKPQELIISDLKWKYLVRAVLFQKNILLIGESGTAKTMAARCVAQALNRPLEIVHCGSTQDARATLIGNTTYKKEIGTLFHKSSFVKAITTENTVILLDELSRGTHDCINILMPVIDPTQRTLRLDEDENSALVKVANGVSFISTANIGNSYTATRVLDKAIVRRFPVKLEMSPLGAPELRSLFKILFKKTTPSQEGLMILLSNIYEDLIEQCKLEDAPISTIIPPANMVEMAELVMDGFVLEEISEAAIYPEYPDDGGSDSERSFVKSILQKYFPKDVKSPIKDPRKHCNVE
jgi:hypothetical protein